MPRADSDQRCAETEQLQFPSDVLQHLASIVAALQAVEQRRAVCQDYGGWDQCLCSTEDMGSFQQRTDFRCDVHG